ncbi:MAG: hypothetical protein WBJ41_08780 [Chromatiaceae bacterium]
MARNAPKIRLILSFIGKTDLKFFPPQGEDWSPILRLLLGLSGLTPRIPPGRTRLLLLDDDPDAGEAERPGPRAAFCAALQQSLPSLGLAGMAVERHPVRLPAGPTDLNALYEQVWGALPASAARQADEVLFHLASGTPAMQFTLMLAAHCLPLGAVRLVETSREQGVREVRPPYVLAARELRERERPGRTSLDARARGALLPDTVVADPLVEAGYAALYKAASNRKIPQRVVLRGPVGSGKWHACQQFARWRKAGVVDWLEPSARPDMPAGATLLIRHLDAWPETGLRELTVLAATRPDLAIAASFRTDLPAVVPLEVLASEGLRGAAQIQLPALGARSDVVALGEALARQLGVNDGKLKQRLQYDLLTDLYPQNLHDLRTLLATTALTSSGPHPERPAYVQAREIRDAERLLAEAWWLLQGTGGYPLDEVLEAIRAAVVRRTLADGRTQEAAGRLLGLSQQRVSTILAKPPDLDILRRRGQIRAEDLHGNS